MIMFKNHPSMRPLTHSSNKWLDFYRSTTYFIPYKLFSILFRLQNILSSPHDDQMEQAKMYIGSSNTSPVPEFLNDQLIEDSIGLSRNCDNDLLFQQLPLPEQLLQSDEKDGEDDSSNSLNNRNDFDLTGPVADDPEKDSSERKSALSAENNGALPSFNHLDEANETGLSDGCHFSEWYEMVYVKNLAILPYVVID